MASLLPIIQELLPMIMPSAVHVARGSDLRELPMRARSIGTQEQEIQLVDEEGQTPLIAASETGEAEEPQAIKTEGPNEGGAPEPTGETDTVPPARPRVVSPAMGPRIFRRDAVVDKTDKMCATVLVAKPKSASTVHHNGEQDAIIYAASGIGILLIGPSDDLLDASAEQAEPTRYVLYPGDFALVPAWTEHQIVNESESEDVMWVVVQSGPVPVEVDLKDWGGEQEEDGGRKR